MIPGDTAPKRGEDLSGTDMFHYANFHANWREISDPGQKNTYFPYRGLPWGRDYRLMLYIFRKLEVALSCNWYVTLRFTVFEIFAILEGQNFGIPWGTAPQKGEDLSGTDMYHRANFHAEQCGMSVPGTNTHFLYRNSPGGYCQMLCIFKNLPSSWWYN